MLHQLSLHWIGVHILQLLLQLFLAPYIEIVKSPLPKMYFLGLASVEWQGQLRPDCSIPSFQQSSRYLLLQHLQNLRWILFGGFADQQMHVFGHYDVSDETESMPAANLIQNFHKAISRPNRS
jgi:hypothetical protein